MTRKSIKEIFKNPSNIRINPNCCTHFTTWDYQIGYVIFPVFKVARCCNCGEIQLICGKFWYIIFKIFFSWFWKGNIHTSEGNILNLNDIISNQVFIINGPPQVGKDTFVHFCQGISPYVYNFSTVSLVKTICSACGWDGKKTPESRKFLSDLKDLLTNSPWGNIIFEDLKKQINQLTGVIIFIHVREPKEIAFYKEAFNATTILIDDGISRADINNHADAEVFNYNYDMIIENKGTLRDLQQKAEDFMMHTMLEKVKKFDVDGDGNYSESTTKLIEMIKKAEEK